MDVARKSDTKIERAADVIWWGVAGVLGLMALWFPHLIKLQTDQSTQQMLVQVGLFFVGAFVGSFRPQRVWRWAAASVIAFVASDFVELSNDSKFYSMGSAQVWSYLASNGSSYAAHAMPVLIGAYLGAHLMRGGVK